MGHKKSTSSPVARRLLLRAGGMIRTETSVSTTTSPAVLPTCSKASAPFGNTLGLFSNDHRFTSCIADSARGCAVSWSVRYIDCVHIYPRNGAVQLI